MSIPYIDQNAFMRSVKASILDFAGGASGKYVVNKVLLKSWSSGSPFSDTGFFKPFEKKNDFFRIYSPITAPVAFGVLAAINLINTAIHAINFLISAATFSGGGMKHYGERMIKGIINTIILCAAAVISPLLNLVDLVGSAVKTVAKKVSKSEKSEGGFFVQPRKYNVESTDIDPAYPASWAIPTNWSSINPGNL